MVMNRHQLSSMQTEMISALTSMKYQFIMETNALKNEVELLQLQLQSGGIVPNIPALPTTSSKGTNSDVADWNAGEKEKLSASHSLLEAHAFRLQKQLKEKDEQLEVALKERNQLLEKNKKLMSLIKTTDKSDSIGLLDDEEVNIIQRVTLNYQGPLIYV